MSSYWLKRKFAQCYFPDKSRKRKLILLYHAVGPGPDAMNQQLFLEQMQWLQEHCEVLSLSELLLAPYNSNKNQVAITFDDGYACLYDECAPILKTLNIPAMVYLNTGWIADSSEHRCLSDEQLGHYPGERFLLWDEVRQLMSDGWEIGSHGVDHVDLTDLKREVVRQQLLCSKKQIELQLQRPCPHFAYTWGRHAPAVRALVKEAGYAYAVAAHHRKIAVQSEPYALPRMNIDKHYSLNDFISIVQGKWDYLGLVHLTKYYIKQLRKHG